MEVYLFFLSGGVDSSLVSAFLSKIKGKPLRAYTLSSSDSFSERDRIDLLKKQHPIDNIYFKPELNHFLQCVLNSIWLGEAEMVGMLSMNAWLEYAFADAIHPEYTHIFTGDGAPDIFPEIAMSRSVFVIFDEKAMLTVFDSLHPNGISADEPPLTARQKRSQLIWKINAKIRDANPFQNYIFPFIDKHYVDYLIASHRNVDPSSVDYKDLVFKMNEKYKLIPSELITAGKQAMPGYIVTNHCQKRFQHIMNFVLHKDTIVASLANHNALLNLSNELPIFKKYRVFMTLFYLNLFEECYVKNTSLTRNIYQDYLFNNGQVNQSKLTQLVERFPVAF